MNGQSLKKRLSANIKEIRSGRFTQETLAEASGISWQMMNGIEGCRKWPSENTLAKIADALEVDVQKLFLPAKSESRKMQDAYDTIKSKIVSRVKKAVEDALEEV